MRHVDTFLALVKVYAPTADVLHKDVLHKDVHMLHCREAAPMFHVWLRKLLAFRKLTKEA